MYSRAGHLQCSEFVDASIIEGQSICSYVEKLGFHFIGDFWMRARGELRLGGHGVTMFGKQFTYVLDYEETKHAVVVVPFEVDVGVFLFVLVCSNCVEPFERVEEMLCVTLANVFVTKVKAINNEAEEDRL